MKKVIMSLAVVATVFMSCKNDKKETVEAKEEVAVEEVANLDNVDLEESVINWKGEKPTGSHHGTIMLEEGSLVVTEGKLTGGEFVIDMSSIQNEDLKEDAEKSAKLVGHLSSEDFFHVEQYPSSKFVITSVEEKEGKLAVTGNLTIKEVTKSITIPAMVTNVDGVTTFESEKFMINRADFNVKYGSKSFFDNLKDKFIHDDIEMSFVVKTEEM